MSDTSVQILIVCVQALVGLTSLLASAISILVWHKITTETKDRKNATNALWDKCNDNNDDIHKNKNNIIRITSSLDIDLVE